MANLIIEKLFGVANLSLEVGSATCQIKDNILMVEVIFPKAYASDGGEKPADFWFKESEARLELELPIPKSVKNVMDHTFFIDSEDEDNEDLTSFFIANTHYPTFDDTILIRQTEDSHVLQWSGLVPDIKTDRYEMYMQIRYKFALETPILFQK